MTRYYTVLRRIASMSVTGALRKVGKPPPYGSFGAVMGTNDVNQ